MACKHSAEEVLDFPDRQKLEGKIGSQCTSVCQELKKASEGDLHTIETEATAIFAREEISASKTVKTLDKMATTFASLTSSMIDKATLAGVNKVNQEFQELIKKSDLDAKEKKELSTSVNEAAKKDPKKFRTFVESKIIADKSKASAKKEQVIKREISFKSAVGKVKKGMKTVGSAGNVAKASRALAGGARGLSKFLTAKKPDGSIDEKKVIGGVIDVVDSIATFLPPPASIVTGTISAIFGIFGGGGGPQIQEIIQEEFEKQKKFIKEEFSKQEKLFRKLMTQTELESVKAKALGVLDALQSRYAFIAAYEGLATCLKEEAVSEITQRVEYFMDQSDAEAVKHTFDTICPSELTKGEATDSQQVCGFLLFTYLVIEEKRHEILTIMINLLSNTENYQELNYGYMNVQSHQKDALKN